MELLGEIIEACANCKKPYETESIEDKLEWNQKGRSGNYYCPCCHTIDDENIIQIKKERFKN